MKKLIVVLALAAASAVVTAAPQNTKPISDREEALHALDRLAFGARPGDVDRVMKIGVDAWIDEQLHPERILDREIDAELQRFTTLSMSDAEIFRQFVKPVMQARRQRRQQQANANGDAAGADDREAMRRMIPPESRPQRLIQELSAARTLRAIESSRQLNEVMVDFWMNHFNVFAGKGVDRVLLTSYERDTIRPRVWGKFEALLMATAKSPAMLFYLDNARSAGDPANRPAMRANMQRGGGFGQRGMRRRQPGSADVITRPQFTQNTRRPDAQRANRGGLNENYAREIMELHTLGVNGGYTQTDVTELARVFTGWTIQRPEEGIGFVFRPQMHDVKTKTVLGVHFAEGGGVEEGERMIQVLAHHPATAHHIAYELCQRLVADDPPASLVDRVAKTFLATDGDLRATVKAVVSSPEFRDPQYFRTKVKSPFEYVVSAARAVDARVTNPLVLAQAIAQIGEPLYMSQPPTGYADTSDVWMNSGALLNRLNYALALASSKLPGVTVNIERLIPAGAAANPQESVDALSHALTGGALSEETLKTIRARVTDRAATDEDPGDNTQLATIAGLILGSPEFQRQ